MIDIFIIKEYDGTRSTLLQYNDDKEKWRFIVKCGDAFLCFGDYQICMHACMLDLAVLRRNLIEQNSLVNRHFISEC